MSVVQNVLWGVRPAVIGLIASAGITIFCMAVYGTREIDNVWNSPDFIAMVIIILGLIVLRKWKVKTIFIMLFSGLVYSIIEIILEGYSI